MIIYKTTNLINGKEYVGLDSKNNPEYYGSGVYLNKAILKYGKVNFKKKIMCRCNSLKELIEAEILYIELYDTYKGKGYNLTSGGVGGDTKNKLSIAAKERYKDNTYREKMKIAQKGKNKGSLNHKSKSVIQLDLKGTFIKEYESTNQAELENNCHNIYKVCQGNQSHAGGFLWEYK